ncbi:hypothetical protein AVEN_199108-1 [Araneus ventricosus]|uniref:Uncharacterized protein n=1 Tax=Araneus ventricosus TaxID=182803 RepID=A0A4Y2P637_ARAVE|nr:hypothetical protein AVEN_199108-1 [Araneus ventricosus]
MLQEFIRQPPIIRAIHEAPLPKNKTELQAFWDLLNPLSGSVSLVKRFEKRLFEDPLSVLKVPLLRTEHVLKAQRIQSLPPPDPWVISNPSKGLTTRIRSIQLGSYSN